MIAARVFLGDRRFLDDGGKLMMVLVEEHQGRLESLKAQMAKALAEFEPAPVGIRLHYENKDCDQIVRPTLRRHRADRGPVFAFLDSFGGPDVSFDLARTVARLPSSEVLITFGTQFLTRFGSVETHQESGDRAFGGPHWRQVLGLEPRDKKPFLVSSYRESLQAAGFPYVVSFEMFDEQGHDLHLVFGTGNKTGLEKMKDAMWKVDPARGVHFRDPRDPDQLGFDFIPTPELGPLRRSLLDLLRHGDRTMAELKEHALLETVYRPRHVGEIVRQLLKGHQVTRDPERGQLTGATRISRPPETR